MSAYCCFKMRYNLTHPSATLYGILYRSEHGWTGIAGKSGYGFEILDWCPWCKAHLPDRLYPPVPEGKTYCTWDITVVCPRPEGTNLDCSKDCPLDKEA